MSSVIVIVMLILLILVAMGMFSSEQRSSSPRERHSVPRSQPRPRSRPTKTATGTALSAMERANYQGGGEYVRIMDIGLLAYRSSDEPRLIRDGDVLMDTRYLRPFVELWLPHDARGLVRFELVDAGGRLRYADESQYALAPGKNTLLPKTWLPLQGKAIPPDDWRLRIMAGQTLLAVHTFGWQPVGGGVIQQYVESDGEISPALQELLHQQPRESVSLADLLSDQEDWT
ncbi:MAG: hypothetical protein JXQ72_06500 [Anaerolineae bacterium]|nr:hypothetical protein [Anaerolineae bacterium]